jgi:phosphoglycerate dehydrogenase-like enzyme
MTKLRVHFESLNSRPVFLITDTQVKDGFQRHPGIEAGLEVSRGEDLQDLPAVLLDIDVLIASEFVLAHPEFPLRDLKRAAPRLQWMHVTNAGIEKLLPLNWLPKGVKLTNSAGAHFPKAKEFAAMTLLMLNAQLPRMVHNQRQSKWEKVLTPTVAGKTLCVVGVGQLGLAFVAEGRRLGLKVIGVRRSGRARPGVDRMYSTTEVGDAVAQADFVVVSAPLTPDTEGMIGAKEFARMRPGVGFVNVGRAKVVDYAALQENLRSGHVSGAILDVFYPEPLPAESDLWQTPNLVMMPHVAMDDTDRFLARCLDIGFENLGRHLRGKRLKNVVNPAKGY